LQFKNNFTVPFIIFSAYFRSPFQPPLNVYIYDVKTVMAPSIGDRRLNIALLVSLYRIAVLVVVEDSSPKFVLRMMLLIYLYQCAV